MKRKLQFRDQHNLAKHTHAGTQHGAPTYLDRISAHMLGHAVLFLSTSLTTLLRVFIVTFDLSELPVASFCLSLSPFVSTVMNMKWAVSRTVGLKFFFFFSFCCTPKIPFFKFFLWRWWTLKTKGNDSAYFYRSSCFAKNSARVRAVLRLLTKHCRPGNGSLLFIIQLNCWSVGLCLWVKSWAEALS